MNDVSIMLDSNFNSLVPPHHNTLHAARPRGNAFRSEPRGDSPRGLGRESLCRLLGWPWAVHSDSHLTTAPRRVMQSRSGGGSQLLLLFALPSCVSARCPCPRGARGGLLNPPWCCKQP